MNSEQALIIAGSTSVQPVMEKIIEEFKKRNQAIKIHVEGGGSSAGIMAALTGTAQLGMCSRELKKEDPKEVQLMPVCIAFDAVTVIVHPSNPVEDLTIAQLRQVFSGKIRSWKDVGGTDRPLHLIVREEGSGTRGAFDELVMKDGKMEFEMDAYALVQDSSGGVREVVRGDPDAVGFISLGTVSLQVKALRIDGITPSYESVKMREYKLVRPFYLLHKGKPSPIAQKILDFSLASESKEIMKKEGLVSAAP